MIKADFEYVYVVLLIGYYLYKAFKGKKEDEEVPTTGEQKKKKSVLEELMEELERQQKANLPKPAPAPAPVPVTTPTVKKKSTPKRVVEPMPEVLAYEHYKSDFVHMESQMVSQIENNEIQVAKPVRKKSAGIRLGSTVLSPKDAIVAQVLFERKF